MAEGQPESVVQEIETMVRSYVEKVMRISFISVEKNLKCS